MPANEDIEHATHDQLVARFADGLRRNIIADLQNSKRDFELQFLQNIEVPGSYFDGQQQARVAKFGKAAYAAMGLVLDDLRHHTSKIAIDGTFGSNGTVAFTKAVDSWRSYTDLIRRVSWVDGRAMEADARTAIAALGAEKVRILNSHRDAWAMPANPLGYKHSIGNLEVSLSLLADHPNLTVLELFPQRPPRRVAAGHILSMLDPGQLYQAHQHLGQRATRILARIPRMS